MHTNNSKHLTLILLGIVAFFASCIGYWYMDYAVKNQTDNYFLAIQESAEYAENKKNEKDLQKLFTQTIDERSKLSSYVISED